MAKGKEKKREDWSNRVFEANFTDRCSGLCFCRTDKETLHFLCNALDKSTSLQKPKILLG